MYNNRLFPKVTKKKTNKYLGCLVSPFLVTCVCWYFSALVLIPDENSSSQDQSGQRSLQGLDNENDSEGDWSFIKSEPIVLLERLPSGAFAATVSTEADVEPSLDMVVKSEPDSSDYDSAAVATSPVKKRRRTEPKPKGKLTPTVQHTVGLNKPRSSPQGMSLRTVRTPKKFLDM